MTTTKLLLLAGFFIVGAIWYFNMTYSLKEFYGHIVKRKRIPLSVLWTIILILQFGINILPIPHTSMSTYIERTGLIFYFAGFAFAIWGRLSMGTNWGIPAQHDISKQKHLVTSGAFNYSRNPIYTGLLVMFLGFELALGSWLIILVIPCALYIRKIIEREEIFMGKYFGDEWEEYKERVTRFFIIV